MDDKLTVSIFRTLGVDTTPLEEALSHNPELQVVGQATDPGTLMKQVEETNPDLALVSFNGSCVFPDWLPSFIQNRPQTAVVVCCNNRAPEFLIQALRAGVREVLPMAPSQEELEHALARVKAFKPVSAPEPAKAHLVAVTSHAGGVGVTSVAVNLAFALAEHTAEKVVLVDLGRPFASLRDFLNISPEHTILDLADNLEGLDLSFLESTVTPYRQVSLLPGSAEPADTWGLEPAGLTGILSLLRLAYDWVILDLGHWVDELSTAVLLEADRVLMVTELIIPHLRNLRKWRRFMLDRGLDPERLQVVVNRYNKASEVRLQDLEGIQERPVLATLPSDYLPLAGAINQGFPLIEAAPRSKLQRSLMDLAQELRISVTGEVAKPRRRFLFF
jgi:pilus assembly protein CpaE